MDADSADFEVEAIVNYVRDRDREPAVCTVHAFPCSTLVCVRSNAMLSRVIVAILWPCSLAPAAHDCNRLVK